VFVAPRGRTTRHNGQCAKRDATIKARIGDTQEFDQNDETIAGPAMRSTIDPDAAKAIRWPRMCILRITGSRTGGALGDFQGRAAG
jgi:hypothetical protein